VLAGAPGVKPLLQLFSLGYGLIALLFAVTGLALTGFAITELWRALDPLAASPPRARAGAIIDSIGTLAVALVALEMSQTVVEEEVVRRVHVSAPTRVRRYLSRFLVVVVVALAIEALVAVVQALHEDPQALPYAAAIAVSAAALLAAWGVFIRLNRAVEELEPEGIEQAKGEDRKLQ
jgi:hypothetical protein